MMVFFSVRGWWTRRLDFTQDLPLDQSLPYSLPDESPESFDIYLGDPYEYLYRRSCILSSIGSPSKRT